ncbi:MAG: hypothetical protein PHH11_11090 [Methylomonas sp.]|nr:hypothetical protein [Methylomonas sp.]
MKMHNPSVYGLLLMGVTAMSNPAQAADAKPMPPAQYPLAEVSISILHQTGHGIPGGYEIAIHGNGNGYKQNTDANPVKIETYISNEILLELLNDFYRIHFFELGDTYLVKKQVLLRDNALVATTALKMADVSSKKLCIQLADYKKCVTIVGDQPVEASQLAAKIEKLFSH